MLAHIICISIFSVQMFKLIDNLVSPTKTYTSVKEVPLKDIDFPLDIKICVTPSLNITVLKGFGYNSTTEYGMGISSRSNQSSVGWGGHGHNGGSLTSAREVFHKAKLNVTRNLLKEVQIATHELILVTLSEASFVGINRLHDCHILNLDS